MRLLGSTSARVTVRLRPERSAELPPVRSPVKKVDKMAKGKLPKKFSVSAGRSGTSNGWKSKTIAAVRKKPVR